MKKTRILLLVLFGAATFSNAQTINRETWYMPLSEDNNYSLYVTEFGQGEPVIVLHGGFGAEHSYLIDLVAPLESNYRFILFDQRGSLRSPAPDSLLTFEGLIKDIENLRKELKIEKIRILGHSMGTRLAMAYADRFPAHVKSLTLVGAVLPKMEVPEGITNPEELPPPKFILAQQYLTSRPEINALYTKHDLEDDSGLNYKQRTQKFNILFASTNLYDISRYNQLKGGGIYYNPKSAMLISSSAPEMYNYIKALRQINIPVTVINGSHDFTDFTALSYEELLKSLNPNMSETPEDWLPGWGDYIKELPQLRHYVIPNAGHAPWVDNKEETIRYLRQALLRY